jgi:hypothetical protein
MSFPFDPEQGLVIVRAELWGPAGSDRPGKLRQVDGGTRRLDLPEPAEPRAEAA